MGKLGKWYRIGFLVLTLIMAILSQTIAGTTPATQPSTTQPTTQIRDDSKTIEQREDFIFEPICMGCHEGDSERQLGSIPRGNDPASSPLMSAHIEAASRPGSTITAEDLNKIAEFILNQSSEEQLQP